MFRLLLLIALALPGCADRAPAATTAAPPTEASAPSGAPCTDAASVDGSALRGFRAGAFVWLDPARGAACAGQATERRVPASTFKIPHALIALDSGVLDGPEAEIAWDRAAYPPEDWWPAAWSRDHTLRSALEHSVVWYYREVARRLGPERERDYLEALGYGNGEVGDNPTSFWLVGPLAISAEEQVVFLRRLWEGSLPASEEVQSLTREMVSVLRDAGGERVLGKTGTARIEGGNLNWLVGVVERAEGPAYFALWAEAAEWLPPDRRLALLDALRAEAFPPPGG